MALHWCGVTIQQPGKLDLTKDHRSYTNGKPLSTFSFIHHSSSKPCPFSLHSDPSLFWFGSLDIFVAETHAVLVQLVEVRLDYLGHDEGGLLDPFPLPCDRYHHIVRCHLEKANFNPIPFSRFLNLEIFHLQNHLCFLDSYSSASIICNTLRHLKEERSCD